MPRADPHGDGMGVHVYCVTAANRVPPEGLGGVDGAAVHVVTRSGLALWVSTLEHRPAATTDSARAHNRVIEAAMDPAATPVPARFGQWFDTDDAAAARLQQDADHWSALLARLAGHAEWGVRIRGLAGAGAGVPADVADVEPARDMQSGTAYMTELARRIARTDSLRRAADALTAEITRRVGGLVRDTRIEQPAGDGVVSLSHLVAWSDAAAYHTVLRTVGEESHGLHFLFTGPWPPYSFVE
jgi:hypothetical protein